PDRQNCLVRLQGSVADKQSQQISLVAILLRCRRVAPDGSRPMVMEQNLVAGPERTSLRPFPVARPARPTRNLAYAMIGGQPKRVAFPSRQGDHGLHAARKKTAPIARPGPSVRQRFERPA